MFEIYTDGACASNGKKNAIGAWGWALFNKDQLIKYNSGLIKIGATNNVAEMTAIYNALMFIKNNYQNTDAKFVIISDSNYCINAIEKWCDKWESFGWYRNKSQTLEVKNKDLWIRIMRLVKRLKNVEYEWTRGHNGSVGNEFIDKIVNTMSQKEFNKEKEKISVH